MVPLRFFLSLSQHLHCFFFSVLFCARFVCLSLPRISSLPDNHLSTGRLISPVYLMHAYNYSAAVRRYLCRLARTSDTPASDLSCVYPSANYTLASTIPPHSLSAKTSVPHRLLSPRPPSKSSSESKRNPTQKSPYRIAPYLNIVLYHIRIPRSPWPSYDPIYRVELCLGYFRCVYFPLR
ncbi:hypothetical protein BJ912DRAFT_965477 [Pholiota molesta]|nr:hypothetical protein BJ912DRAFT_965477 [Pholiota molesta]